MHNGPTPSENRNCNKRNSGNQQRCSKLRFLECWHKEKDRQEKENAINPQKHNSGRLTHLKNVCTEVLDTLGTHIHVGTLPKNCNVVEGWFVCRPVTQETGDRCAIRRAGPGSSGCNLGHS